MPEAEIPYLLTKTITLGGNARGTLSMGVSTSEEFEGHRAWFLATGAFSIEGVKTSDGVEMSSADPDNPIPSTMLFEPQTGGEGIGTFIKPLLLRAGRNVEYNLLDTSTSSNTIRLVIEGIKRPVA